MNDNFKMFRKTGEIKYYLKYKEEMKIKEEKNTDGNTKAKGNSSRCD